MLAREESLAPTDTNEKADFFISYNKADRAWAEWIAWQLVEADYSVRLQAWHFRPGHNFVLEMQHAAVEAERTIAVLSPSYLISRFTQAEWAAAFVQDPTGEKGLLVPIRVRECDPPGLLAAIIYQDLVGLNEEDARAALLAALIGEAMIPTAPPPFPGAAIQPRAAPPRFPGRLPPIWNVPHLRNPLFVGREDLFAALEPESASDGRVARVRSHAIHGLGGMGKTQLAVEAAYRGAPYYDIIWWLRAEDGTALLSDYIALGKALGLPEAEQPDQPAALEAIRRRLELGPERWLLVFDNAVQAAQLLAYLPRAGDGDVLITSRNPEWIGTADPVPLVVLSESEAIQFLLNRTGRADEANAAALARELGYLPLALAQAAAYAAATGMTLARYLELFQQHYRQLLARGDPHPVYPDTVATTWELSFQLVAAQSPAARDILNFIAFFAPDAIPMSLLTDQAGDLPETLATAVRDVIPLEDAKALLRSFSLVELVGDQGFSVHRLVQMVIRDRLSPEEQRKWAGVAVCMVTAAFPGHGDDERTWPTCQRLLLHGLATVAEAIRLDVEPAAAIRLLNHMGGGYLKSTSQLQDARRVLSLALSVSERHSEEFADLLSSTLSNLGSVLSRQGNFGEAREHIERALALDEAVFGANHHRLGSKLNNLASILHKQGDLDGAQRLYERALAIAESNYEPPDTRVAVCLDNLGGVLLARGDLTGARERFERALEIDTAIFGPVHASVASHLNSLGTVIRAQGDLPGAQARLKQALQISEIALGPTHPAVATVLNNLAAVQIDRRQLAGARLHLRRAFSITERKLGPDHPEVGTILHNLASVHSKLGDQTTAIDLHRRALRIAEASHGLTHPDVAALLKGMAGTYLRNGEPGVAKNLYERALAIWTARRDSDRQAEVLADLALAEDDLGNRDEAMSRLHQAITLLQQSPPSELEMACFSKLGIIALQAGFWAEGLQLAATAVSVAIHSGLDADESLDGLRRQFAGLGVDNEEFDALIIQAEQSYGRDRGQELIQAIVNS